MGQEDIEVRVYFSEYAERTGDRVGIVRASNALVRGGCITMSRLCEMSVDELAKMRNMGEKSIALALGIRKRYMKGL